MNRNPIVKITDANRDDLVRRLYELGYRRHGLPEIERGLAALNRRNSYIYVHPVEMSIACLTNASGYCLMNSPTHMISYLKAKGMTKQLPVAPLVPAMPAPLKRIKALDSTEDGDGCERDALASLL